MSDDTLQHTTFDGIADYIAALDTVCSSAQRTLNIFRTGLSKAIGFNSEARYATSARFPALQPAKPPVTCWLTTPQHLVRYCPRMMMLLHQFGNGMSIYQTPKSLQHVTEPFCCCG